MIHNDRFFKLEMLILSILNCQDCTSEELASHLQSLKIKEGVILTTLFFFLESHLISRYQKENRTYYHIESAGIVRLDTLKRRYLELEEDIKDIINNENIKISK